MWLDIGLLVLGLAVLVVGGEFLVRGAVNVARSLKVSTLVIGMTVVSFGTSAPELLVSLTAAAEGHSSISIGNVVGSNIANIALVLGITLIIFPIVVNRTSKIIDWPVMMGATVLFSGMFLYDGELARWEGAVLFGLIVVFTTLLIRHSRKKTKKAELESNGDVDDIEKAPVWKASMYLAIGLVGLYFGAEWMLDGAIGLAKEADMSEELIAVTIIAFGTSVPELVTSAVAAFRKETDISIGNLIGSNLFNICVVLGLTAIVSPIDDQAQYANILEWDMYWMIGVSLLVLPLMLIGKRMARWQGFLLLFIYIAFILTVIERSGATNFLSCI